MELEKQVAKDYLLQGYKKPNEIKFLIEVFKKELLELHKCYNNIGIELSGGKDTRLIALLCKQLNIPVTALTTYYPRVHEIDITRQVANVLEIPLIEIQLKDYLLLDRLTQYSYLGKKVSYPYEDKYQQFDTVISGWGLTEACRVDKPASYFYNYIFPSTILSERTLNIQPLIKCGDILPSLLGFKKERYRNAIHEMICNLSPEMGKIEYFNSGLLLYKSWKKHERQRKQYQQSYKQDKENLHIPYDPEYWIRTNMKPVDFTMKVRDLYTNGIIDKVTMIKLFANIQQFFSKQHNDRRYATRTLYLWEIMKEVKRI